MDPPPFEFNMEKFQQQYELEVSLLEQQSLLLREWEASSNQTHRRKYIDRDHAAAHKRLVEDYFAETPTYTDPQFRRRYRMRRPLFLRIVESLSTHDIYFTQRHNNSGKLGLSPLQKCTAAIRMLAYGIAADACDEYVKIGEINVIEYLEKFCEGNIAIFETTYLRRPNEDDLERVLQVCQKRGFHRMIGSIDCMHWQWKNCLKAWQGQFTNGHKGTATVILEAVASYDLWIWHAFFGLLGTLNDINVLDRSPVFDDIETGEAPRVNYTMNGRNYNLTYYLADGIYPKWNVFVQSIQFPQGEKAQLFIALQETFRKDAERAFGVLQARFSIIRQPARLWDLNVLSKIMRVCIILHNMIVDDERDTYSRSWENPNPEPSATAGPSSSSQRPNHVLPEFEVHVQARSDSDIHTRSEICDRAKHIQLKEDLIEHIWQKFRDNHN